MKFNSLKLKILPLMLLAMACQQETDNIGSNENGNGDMVYSFHASIGERAKASISDDGSISWDEEDQIAVYDEKSGKFCTFTCQDAEKGIFNFTGVSGEEYSFTRAFYPASIAQTTAAIELPDEYSANDARAGKMFPMQAVADGNQLDFRHLGALLKYTISGISAEADRIEIYSSEAALSGEFTIEGAELENGWVNGDGEDVTISGGITMRSSAHYPEIHSNPGTGKVTIRLTPGETSSMVFYLPLPIGAYSCTCEIKNGSTVLASYTTHTPKDIQRARLVKMSPIYFGFSGGLGTEQQPYLISCDADLVNLSALSADDSFRSAHYLQTADIDLSAFSSFSPICSVNAPFTGTYDGGGHSISALRVNQEGNNAGLFGYIGGGTVKNVTIQGGSIQGSANYAAAIAGVLNGGNIIACKADAETTVEAAVRGAGCFAGLVRSGSIDACEGHGRVIAGEDVAGGIAGYLYPNADGHDILIINCVYSPVYKDGKLSAASVRTGSSNAYMGGIAGSANAEKGRIRISNCYANPLELRTTQASGSSLNYVGGILGRSVKGEVGIFNCLTPITYSNIVFSGDVRLNAKTCSNYKNAACIVGTISQNGTTISRVFSKNTWAVSFNKASGAEVTASDIAMKMGESNMRGFGGFCFSSDYPVSGNRSYPDGVLEAVNDGAAAWNGENPSTPAREWVFVPTFGLPEPSGLDNTGPVTKKISIIGDSISTYEGYIFSTEDAQMNKFYPDIAHYDTFADKMVLNEQETWWWRIIYEKMSCARLEADNAFGGSTVTYSTVKIDGMPRDPSDRMIENSLQQRYLDYGLGSPDILFFHGGRNDFGQYGGNTDVLLGDFSDTSLQAAYNAPAGTLFNNYSQGTVAILRDFHSKNPSAKILIIIHDMMSDGYDSAAEAIRAFLSAKGFDIRAVSLHKPGTNNKTNEDLGISKESGTHPDKAGCSNMADYIYGQAGNWLEEVQ